MIPVAMFFAKTIFPLWRPLPFLFFYHFLLPVIVSGVFCTTKQLWFTSLAMLSRDEVDTMLGIELEQTRVYREAEQQGSVRGRQEEAQSLILRQLNRRVGNISIDLEAQIKTLPLAQLEELGEALLDFSQMADLVAWLER
jgi:hypothetical protein